MRALLVLISLLTLCCCGKQSNDLSKSVVSIAVSDQANYTNRTITETEDIGAIQSWIANARDNPVSAFNSNSRPKASDELTLNFKDGTSKKIYFFAGDAAIPMELSGPQIATNRSAILEIDGKFFNAKGVPKHLLRRYGSN